MKKIIQILTFIASFNLIQAENNNNNHLKAELAKKLTLTEEENKKLLTDLEELKTNLQKAELAHNQALDLIQKNLEQTSAEKTKLQTTLEESKLLNQDQRISFEQDLFRKNHDIAQLTDKYAAILHQYKLFLETSEKALQEKTLAIEKATHEQNELLRIFTKKAARARYKYGIVGTIAGSALTLASLYYYAEHHQPVLKATQNSHEKTEKAS